MTNTASRGSRTNRTAHRVHTPGVAAGLLSRISIDTPPSFVVAVSLVTSPPYGAPQEAASRRQYGRGTPRVVSMFGQGRGAAPPAERLRGRSPRLRPRPLGERRSRPKRAARPAPPRGPSAPTTRGDRQRARPPRVSATGPPEQIHEEPAGEPASSSLAGRTGLEPAAFGVTGRRYNRLNYRPKAVGLAPRGAPHPLHFTLWAVHCNKKTKSPQANLRAPRWRGGRDSNPRPSA